jgi:hypothetical protein
VSRRSLRAPLRGAFWVVCVLALLAPEPAAAITFQTTLSPIRLYGQPGQTLTNQYQLTLDKGQPTTQFRVTIEDWWRSLDGRQSFYVTAGSLPRSCGSWVTVNPAESRVAGGEKLSVRVSVSVPPTAQPGGYWCALTIEEVGDPLAMPTDVGVKFLASVSTSIYVYLDPVQRDVRIEGIEQAGSEVVVSVRNQGNTPVPVEGRFEFLRPGETDVVATAPLDRNVLLMDPMPAGRFGAALPAPEILPAGRYVVRVVLDIGLDHFIGAQRDLVVARTPLLRGQ